MTSPELDANKIAAAVIQNVLTDTTRAITGGLRDFFTRVLAVFRKDLKSYLVSTIDKCSHLKTPIINRDRPTYLFDIYVNTRIKVRGKVFKDDEFIPMAIGLKSVVIAGHAGSGKSMLMRYLFISLCERGYGRIPLFIELRNLNNFDVKDLLAFIYYSVVGPGGVITREQFESGLTNGAFTVILDGFDEVDFDQRKSVETQIFKLRERYPELVLIVSSRPDPQNRFNAWARFHVCDVQPMDEQQATQLIRKIDYDGRIKNKFLKALKDSLFETHESFLSNPLLCIMMLITFGQIGHIPDKMHIFLRASI